MKPKVLLPILSKFKEHLLPDWVIEELSTHMDLKIVFDPDNLSSEEYDSLFRDIDAMISTWEIPMLNTRVISKCPNLKIISHAGGQVRFFIPEALFDLRPDLLICNASNVMARPVAEHTLMMSIALLRNLFFISRWAAENEDWEKYPREKNVSLLNKKVGLVGLGQIANEFIELARPFKVEFNVYSRHLGDFDAEARGLKKSSLEKIFSTCDVITICAANTPENRHMINRDLLRLIKPGAVLVNNARGALIDEQALCDELESGRFSAAIDVTEPEPPAMDSRLRSLPNVFLTPHSAGPTPDQWPWMVKEAADIIRAYYRNQPVWNIIDRKRFRYMA